VTAGIPYIGESAGAMVLAPNIDYAASYDNPKMAQDITDYNGLGIVDFYPCPHYTNQPFKRAVEKIIAQYDSHRKLMLMSNKQAVLVNETTVSLESV
jgi:dipeptidase E